MEAEGMDNNELGALPDIKMTTELKNNTVNVSENIETLQGKHEGKPCTIVGTGPSILKINESYFSPDEIIITLNDSIVQIERLDLNNIIYSMQKDFANGIIRPKKAILLVNEHESKFAFEDYSPRYVFDAKKLFNGKNQHSANCALKIIQLFGCSKIRLIGFDSCTTKDTRRVGLNGTISKGQPKLYMLGCTRMRDLIRRDKLNVEFIL